MMSAATEVEIPIFLHPHLFWIFEKKNTIKRHQLESELCAEYSRVRGNDGKFEIGQEVVVKKKNRWCRGMIKDIIRSVEYTVWLYDYGCLFHTHEVYTLKENFKSYPPLVKQASLNNVVFIDETFSLEKSCIDRLKSEQPNAGTTLTALQFLEDYMLFFVSNKEMNYIHFGDILYKKNYVTTSLTTTLIEKGLMIEDEQLFRKIEESRIFDRDFQMNALRHASKYCKESIVDLNFDVLMNEILTRQSPRDISLGGSFTESESEDSKPKMSGSSLRKFLNERRKISNNEKSENNEESPKVSRLQVLLQRKKANSLINSSDVETSGNNFDESLSETSFRSFDNYQSEISFKSNENSMNESQNFTPNTRSNLIKKLLRKNTPVESSDESFYSCETNDEKSLENKSIFNKSNEERAPKILQEQNAFFVPCGSQFKSRSCLSDSSLLVSNKKAKKFTRKSEERKPNCINETNESENEWDNWKDPMNLKPALRMKVKPKCNCDQCNHWANSDDWRKKPGNFGDKPGIENMKISQPLSLLLKKKRESVVKLSSIKFNSKSKLQKKASQKLLVHGLVLPAPIERVVEAPFHQTVHNSLRNLGWNCVETIQSYIIPAVSRNMNVCYINTEKTGKTLAYLPVLCSFLLEKDELYNDLKKGGPIITILCKNSKKCEEIYTLTNKLLIGYGVNKPRVYLVSYPFAHVNMSNVDVLITIPPVLIELLKKNATNMKRLCHLVLEDVDLLMEKYPSEISATIGVVESMLSNRIVKTGVQLLLLGEHWTLKVENFTKKLREIPLISIGDYLEAAIYGRIKIQLKLIEPRVKEETLIELLKDKWKFFKSVVVTSDDQMEELKTILLLNSISFIDINDSFSMKVAIQQETNWESCHGDDCKVLICTDQFVQSNMTITSAALLIHYSLPENWSTFVNRFECLLDNCRSPLISNNNKLLCESYILTDKICENVIPRLLRLLKNYNGDDNQLATLVEQNRLNEESSKIVSKIVLCESMKLFGYCNEENCPNRHVLDCELDTNPIFPKNGTIKFKIIEVLNVNHLKVNIIEHKDLDGKITEFKSRSNFNDMDLTKILNKTRKEPEEITKKNLYAYWDLEDFDGVFRKCIVEDYKNDKVDILIIENGKRLTVCKNKILELSPDEENDTKLCTFELVISNFKPPYKDENFSSKSVQTFARFIENLNYDDNMFVADICLQLGGIFWIKNITEEVNVFELDLTKTCITMELLKQKLAVVNENHLKSLYNLCEKAGIVLPKYEKVIEKTIVDEESQAVPQWAFLDQENVNKVVFSSAISPDEMYFRLEKFDALLLSLENDLMDIVARQGGKRNCKVTPGSYYLAKDEESNKFDRILVKKIENDSVLGFSVDYGHEAVVKLDDIRYLPNHLITKLPFQAIQCSLYGVQGIDNEWPQEATDIFYDKFTLKPNSDSYRILNAKSVHCENGTFRGQLRFSILLKDNLDGDIMLNRLLVDCGWAELMNDAEFLKDFDVNSNGEIYSDEDDVTKEVIDIIETTQMVSSNNVELRQTGRDEENSELELFLCDEDEDQMDYLTNFIQALNYSKIQKEESSRVIQNVLPSIEAGPLNDFYTPDVFWTQTKKAIQLMIKIPNVETYKFVLQRSRIISFRTVVNGKEYRLNMVLYEAVEKNYTHRLSGLEVRINLAKKEELEWPRLSQNEKRLRNVHYMIPNKKEMTEGKKRLFLDFGDEFKDEPDEDGPMFTLLSDRDSEFDLDLESDSN